MTIFAIFRVADPERLKSAVTTHYPTDHLQISPNEWLVSARATAKEVSDKLEISQGKIGLAIVVAIAGYYGRAPSNVWEWMKIKMETADG